jgi:hypothetical protein
MDGSNNNNHQSKTIKDQLRKYLLHDNIKKIAIKIFISFFSNFYFILLFYFMIISILIIFSIEI